MRTLSDERKADIANSFPAEFEEFDLHVVLTGQEWEVFEQGIISSSMDEKWDVFLVGSYLYWSRSWTGNCIFKIIIDKGSDQIVLGRTSVNRNPEQYKNIDIADDKIYLLKLIQLFTKREDLYIDPELSVPPINAIIHRFDPENDYKKSVGHSTVGLTRRIFEAFISNSGDHARLHGWDDLKSKFAGKKEDDPLIDVHLSHRRVKDGFTLYFDKRSYIFLGTIKTEINFP